MEYLLTNYVRDDAKFPPSVWAAPPSDGPRTTNSVESFNSHYNAEFYHALPHIHLVIETLEAIQTDIDLLLNSIHRGRINPRANENAHRRQLLKDMYDQYRCGDHDRLGYLQLVGYHCQPIQKKKTKTSSESTQTNV